MTMESGLYLVGTPIGNLSDMSRRAVDTLAEADVVYAEDTRRTGVLLKEMGIESSLRSLHEHNEARRVAEVLDRLGSGEAVALVSDAGTPAVSDPGRRVVEEALEAGHRVVPVPGTSAVTAALSVSGLPADRFLFLGFPPRKGQERDRWMERLAGSELTVVAFSSPHRLPELLVELEERGLGERIGVLCRELTKRFEEVTRATISQLQASHSEEVRGEVTLVLEGGEPEGWEEEEERLAEVARSLLREGRSTPDVVAHLREGFGVPRNEAYQLVLDLSEETG